MTERNHPAPQNKDQSGEQDKEAVFDRLVAASSRWHALSDEFKTTIKQITLATSSLNKEALQQEKDSFAPDPDDPIDDKLRYTPSLQEFYKVRYNQYRADERNLHRVTALTCIDLRRKLARRKIRLELLRTLRSQQPDVPDKELSWHPALFLAENLSDIFLTKIHPKPPREKIIRSELL